VDDQSAFADRLVSAARTALGDSLRAVVSFTPDEFTVAYLRRDRYDGVTDRARRVKRAFVEAERLGFDTQAAYASLSSDPETEPGIGAYEFTVRVFSAGYVTRVVVGERGVVLTTDGLDIAASRELAVTLRKLLAAPEGGEPV
jgi:hypothetical protein